VSPGVREVHVDADTVMRLGQFLKLADAVDTGGEAKILISSGDVEVNGEVEFRRGRQLRKGDEVSVLGREYRLI
jgi:ribosome-associated protein